MAESMAAGDAPTRAPGTMSAGGSQQYGAAYEDLLEHVPDLRWPTSIPTYAKMRHDPVLTSLLKAYTLPITRASWAINPAGAAPATVQVVADSLGLPVLGDGNSTAGGVRRRGVQWGAHLSSALRYLVYGHMPFVPFADLSDGRAVLAGLPERMPWTITDLETDTAGALVSITQSANFGAQGVKIPGDALLWYVNEREGANWTGQSLLRPCFGSWLLKQEALRVQATAFRRFGAPVPSAEAIPGSTPTQAQHAAAQAVASNVRVGDTGGVAMPPNYTLRLKGVEGTMPDGLPFLRFLNEEMARSGLASMLDLGGTANGSRALGDSFAELLGLAQQAVAEQVAATATAGLAVRLTDWNAGVDAPVPAIVVGDVSSSRATLSEIVSGLVQSGVLTRDDGLEDWVREAFDLPLLPAQAPTVIDVKARRPDLLLGGALRMQHATRVRAAAGQRKPTALETAAGVKPGDIDAATDDIVTATVAQYAPLVEVQQEELATQVEAAVTAGDLAALAALTVVTTAAAAVLADAMLAGWAVGAASAATEAIAQGLPSPDPGTPDEAAIADYAGAQAALLASGLAGSAGREALRLAVGGADAGTVTSGVIDHMAGLSDAGVRDVVAGVVQAGLAEGRGAAFTAAETADGPVATYFHSAIRDKGTCVPCAEHDQHEYSSLAAALADFPVGYVHCEGRYRCRCVIAAKWETP